MGKPIDIVAEASTTTSPWQNLANAIVIVAANDYRAVLRELLHEPSRKRLLFANRIRRKDDIEAFFKSSFCEILTKCDAYKIMGDILEDELQKATDLRLVQLYAEGALKETEKMLYDERAQKRHGEKSAEKSRKKVEKYVAEIEGIKRFLCDIEIVEEKDKP